MRDKETEDWLADLLVAPPSSQSLPLVRLLMKRIILILAFFILNAFAISQNGSRIDVLGPHANFGRGCSSCHIHQSATTRRHRLLSANALWGQNDTRPYGAGSLTYITAKTPERIGILLCISCHDGNYASEAPRKDTIYEALPVSYGAFNIIPTFTKEQSVITGSTLGAHPVGLDTQLGCGGPEEWDCTSKSGVIVMDGTKSSRFVFSYGFFNKPHPYEGKEVVVCSTCHNPHSENVMSVTRDTQSGAYSPGTYPTIAFLRAPYDPSKVSISSNQSAQYCRQCHADKSNEMNGSSCGTLM